MDERVRRYWTQRAPYFSTVRRNELQNDMCLRWSRTLNDQLPRSKPLDILDIGTGTGFFAVLLAKEGHHVCGIDFTPAMLGEARRLASEMALHISFQEMDAQNLEFPDNSFDAIVSRNLTWTLPDPKRAYQEWYRVLRHDGVLLNFDANYGEQIRCRDRQNVVVSEESPYGHIGVTPEMEKENEEITLSMSISQEQRPSRDCAVLKELGFSSVERDTHLGKHILSELDVTTAPMFMVRAVK